MTEDGRFEPAGPGIYPAVIALVLFWAVAAYVCLNW